MPVVTATQLRRAGRVAVDVAAVVVVVVLCCVVLCDGTRRGEVLRRTAVERQAVRQSRGTAVCAWYAVCCLLLGWLAGRLLYVCVVCGKVI
jgi:hypothetical protein